MERNAVPIDDESAAAANIVDGVLQNLDGSRSLNDCGLSATTPRRSDCAPKLTDVETIRVISLQLVKLRAGVLARELDVGVGRIEALGQLHLETLGSRNSDLAASVLAQQLSKHLRKCVSTYLAVSWGKNLRDQ